MKRINNYIVLEGIDGSGKSVLCNLLEENLKSAGYKVLTVSEPSKSNIGVLLREYLKSGQLNQISLSLLFAADSYNLQDKIKFSDYDIVISDRNYLSTVAYQMLEVEKSWLYNIHDFLCVPSMLIYLDVLPDVAHNRIKERKKDKDIFETQETLVKIHQNYKEILSELSNFPIYKINASYIDSNKACEQAMSIINKQIKFC